MKPDIRDDEPPAGGRACVYIDRDGEGVTAPVEGKPSSSGFYGKVVPDATENTPSERIQIPDGRYTKGEFDRAAKYCLENEP